MVYVLSVGGSFSYTVFAQEEITKAEADAFGDNPENEFRIFDLKDSYQKKLAQVVPLEEVH